MILTDACSWSAHTGRSLLMYLVGGMKADESWFALSCQSKDLLCRSYFIYAQCLFRQWNHQCHW